MIPVKDSLPTERVPVVTVGLILANVIVYLLVIPSIGDLFSGPSPRELATYGAMPYALTHGLGEHCRVMPVLCSTRALPGTLPAWETAFTSMFVHGSMIHLVVNMLFLWMLGPTVEDAMGRLKYLGFYIVGGLAALALEVVVAPNATTPTIGAAGAISGVIGGYIMLYPRGRVLTLVTMIFFLTVIELPAPVVVALWFVAQAVFAATNLIAPTGSIAGVAFVASVGGFAFGLLAVKLLARRRQQVPPAVMAH